MTPRSSVRPCSTLAASRRAPAARRSGFPFTGFTTEVVGVKFLRNAYEGFGPGDRFRTYEHEELEEFLDTFAPLFDVDRIHDSPIGRALTPNHGLHDRPLGEVLYELTGKENEELVADLEAQPTVTPGSSVQHFDPFDLHLRSSPYATAPTFCARPTPPTTPCRTSDASGSRPRAHSPTTTGWVETRLIDDRVDAGLRWTSP